jgi:hypothetical protein
MQAVPHGEPSGVAEANSQRRRGNDGVLHVQKPRVWCTLARVGGIYIYM